MTDAQQMIIAQEGSGPTKDGRFFPYDDATGKRVQTGDTIQGKVTIGYGSNIQDDGLSVDTVFLELNGHIANAIEAVRHNFSCYDQLSRPRQLVLISMAYNLGQTGLSRFVHFIADVQLGKYDEAADELLNSLAAKQAPSRYQELAKMMRENVSEWI